MLGPERPQLLLLLEHVVQKLVIKGGVPLHGEISVSGAKNAALPLLASALLTDEPVVFENVPELADVNTMIRLLGGFGMQD